MLEIILAILGGLALALPQILRWLRDAQTGRKEQANALRRLDRDALHSGLDRLHKGW